MRSKKASLVIAGATVCSARVASPLVAIATVGLFAATSLADVQALVGEENGNLTNLDITTGTSSTLKDTGVAVLGLAYNATETTLYGAVASSIGNESYLATINQSTGAYTTIGPNGVDLSTLTSLTDGRLFGVDLNGELYQVNASSGATSLIGSTNLTNISNNSLASNGTTLYYTYDSNGGVSSLYTLNVSTGAATLVGSTGVDAIVGSAYAGPTYATSSLYTFSAEGQTDLINLTTGAATPVSNNGLVDIYGGVGIITTVPEPTSALLAVTGAIGLLGMRRRTGSSARYNLRARLGVSPSC